MHDEAVIRMTGEGNDARDTPLINHVELGLKLDQPHVNSSYRYSNSTCVRGRLYFCRRGGVGALSGDEGMLEV